MKGKKGLTLIELLIAIAIFTIVITLAGTLFVSGFRNYEKVSSILTGQSGTRLVMYEISKELRNATADEITINATNTSITIDDVTFTYSSENTYVSVTRSGTTSIIARNISGFYVELVDETVNYSIQSFDESAGLNSSVTVKEFDRPSPT